MLITFDQSTAYWPTVAGWSGFSRIFACSDFIKANCLGFVAATSSFSNGPARQIKQRARFSDCCSNHGPRFSRAFDLGCTSTNQLATPKDRPRASNAVGQWNRYRAARPSRCGCLGKHLEARRPRRCSRAWRQVDLSKECPGDFSSIDVPGPFRNKRYACSTFEERILPASQWTIGIVISKFLVRFVHYPSSNTGPCPKKT